MEKKPFFKKTTALVAATLVFIYFFVNVSRALALPPGIKNIVLVHGNFADGSGWEGVFKILSKKGYNVIIVQNPSITFEGDVATVNQALNRLDGPAILVGHSSGGAIITQAGVSPKVAGLVYISGFQPEVGETIGALAGSAPTLPENGILPPDADGILWYDKAKFRAGFAAELSQAETDFMYASQIPVAATFFSVPLTEAAWKTKPSWAVIPGADKSINPIIQRTMCKRSGAKVTEIAGACHVVYVSHPKEVAAVIEEAAIESAKRSQ